ncbi:MAG: DUF1385 domain-containing protein [Peptococcaceae bacterium]|nr:DUF1385 domain-containing protein [Peptococcaceae bacterium]
MSKPVSYGGQALIEGVMMRAPKDIAMAVRLPDGNINVERQPIKPWSAYPVLKLPVIRGFVALLDSLVVGMKALSYSAGMAAEGQGEEIKPFEMLLTIVVSLGLGLLLFVALPTGMANLVKAFVPGVLLQNILEGVLRLGIFLLYVVAISRMKDIQRVFQYHGAEHMAIFTYEEGLDLTVDNARQFTTLHPRCGTSFLLIVMVVSIVVFAFLPLGPLWLRLVSRLLAMPLVAGIAYEFLKLSGNYCKSRWFRWAIVPGLWLQKLTTSQPDDSQLEVALAALKSIVESGQELS